MQLPHLRPKRRWMILGMATVAIIVGLWCRHVMFRNLADRHYDRLPAGVINVVSDGSEADFRLRLFENRSKMTGQNAKDSWHAAMAYKYERAARSP